MRIIMIGMLSVMTAGMNQRLRMRLQPQRQFTERRTPTAKCDNLLKTFNDRENAKTQSLFGKTKSGGVSYALGKQDFPDFDSSEPSVQNSPDMNCGSAVSSGQNLSLIERKKSSQSVDMGLEDDVDLDLCELPVVVPELPISNENLDLERGQMLLGTAKRQPTPVIEPTTKIDGDISSRKSLAERLSQLSTPASVAVDEPSRDDNEHSKAANTKSEQSNHIVSKNVCPNRFKAGESVKVHGLQLEVGMPYNNTIGTVDSYLEDKDRYVISIPETVYHDKLSEIGQGRRVYLENFQKVCELGISIVSDDDMNDRIAYVTSEDEDVVNVITQTGRPFRWKHEDVSSRLAVKPENLEKVVKVDA